MKNTIVCMGELLIDFVPVTNGLPLSEVAHFQRAAGGAPGNVAAAIARLGGAARMIGKVGQDAFGDFLIRTLREADVDVAHSLLQTAEAKTGLAFVSLRANGERDFMFYRSPGADMLIRPDEIQETWLSDAAIFHFGSLSLVDAPCRAATDTAILQAKQMGAILSFDPNVRLPLWPSETEVRSAIISRLHVADLVKVSAEEVEFLTGKTDVAAGARQMLELGPQAMIVTLGANGCTFYTKQSSIHVPGIPVEAVDTTGAGDGFVGGLLYQLVKFRIGSSDAFQQQLQDLEVFKPMLHFANGVGAVVTTKRGAIPAMPTLHDAEQFLSSRRQP
jgi:fructokinase